MNFIGVLTVMGTCLVFSVGGINTDDDEDDAGETEECKSDADRARRNVKSWQLFSYQ